MFTGAFVVSVAFGHRVDYWASSRPMENAASSSRFE
ncbi:hypothetical protein DFR72_121187 [Lentzea flaviverrucosa]|nr:hypothetical protein DFR72_121187 [Lentzea flaviverrucosa]